MLAQTQDFYGAKHSGVVQDGQIAATNARRRRSAAMSIIWTIIIGFVAGVIAKLITPGDNEPAGFILTTILGMIRAFVATYSVRPSAGTGRVKALGSSERSSARSSCW